VKIGSICVVVPIDDMVRCPVWFSDKVDADEGDIKDVYSGTVCTVIQFEELPSTDQPGERSQELWAKALFPIGIGWIPACDLKDINDDT